MVIYGFPASFRCLRRIRWSWAWLSLFLQLYLQTDKNQYHQKYYGLRKSYLQQGCLAPSPNSSEKASAQSCFCFYRAGMVFYYVLFEFTNFAHNSYHIISHVGSGIVPVDGVGRISYGHRLYHASPFFSITCISFPGLFFFISFSTCFFHVCFGLPLHLLPLTSNLTPSLSHFHLLSSKHDRTTVYCLL